ncbi:MULTISPECIES: TIGR02206 family membrane protein [Paenibacillus]|uniref:YwaF family protein n=1 Tax=Paenibacillus TaxID=44249 RepID=UPI002FDF279D
MILSFFNSREAPDFLMFSAPHLISIALLLVFALALFLTRRHIREKKTLRLAVRCGLIFLLILCEGSLNIWYFAEEVWDIRYTLPLELCTITLLLSILMLWTRTRWLYEILLFAGIGGALQAFLTPNLAYGFPHFRFFQFFIAHLAIILAPLYMTWVEGYRPTWRSIGKTMLFLNVLALAVGLLNAAIGANYMFLLHKPDTPSVLDWLGPHPLYLLAEEAIALFLFVVIYGLFFALGDYIKKRRKAAGRIYQEKV